MQSKIFVVSVFYRWCPFFLAWAMQKLYAFGAISLSLKWLRILLGILKLRYLSSKGMNWSITKDFGFWRQFSYQKDIYFFLYFLCQCQIKIFLCVLEPIWERKYKVFMCFGVLISNKAFYTPFLCFLKHKRMKNIFW